MEFNQSYTLYWQSAVQKSVDGTIIAGPKHADHFLYPLDLKRNDIILDLGCSTGRMYEMLNSYSDSIYGIEPDNYAISIASKLPYLDVRLGTVEAIGYPNDYFDFVFCWAVFDVVNHKKGLTEINRILKNGGRFLITGKGDNYNPEDILAFKAEKNAFLKGFPNRFTNLGALCSQINLFGFAIINLFTFPCRGDIGKLNYQKNNLVGHETQKIDYAYEYLMIAEKKCDPNFKKIEDVYLLENAHTFTAKVLAKKAGFSSVKQYFEFIGLD